MDRTNLAHIFKSYDIRGKVGSELSVELCSDVGRAIADFLPETGIVAIGRDMRPDSEELANAVIAGLRAQGRPVWDIGLITSDMVYFAVGRYDLAGGVVVTASHNPGDYNGIKIYRDHVTAVGLDSGLDIIRDAVFARSFKDAATEQGTLESRDISDDWVEHVLGFVKPESWPKYHIAIDAGNGMAGAILPKILPKLPLEVERLYFELDGTFPNHEANPQNLETLKDLCRTVREHGYDFGIAFDGDGDRAALVDDLGRPVPGTDVIALVAHYYLQKYPGAEVIHEVRTSRATKELIKEWGGVPVRTKAGRIQIGVTLREKGAPFGGETTGHLFFKENYDADSGLIGALVAIQALAGSGKKLSELADEYRRYVMIPEAVFKVEDGDATLSKLRDAFKDGEQDELDGLTVEYDYGWFNIRKSNTEPVIKLNAEAINQEKLDELVGRIRTIIEEKGTN
jgi:phosphomannomutase